VRAYRSWGRFSSARHTRVLPVAWRADRPRLDQIAEPVLPYACGRSYGDSCLNDGGALLDVTGLDRFIAFDPDAGVLRCETGVTLAAILDLIVPQGWFLPVVPGTRWVSVGGAIANDIHGKNHHRAGTFGCHVSRLELLRSNGERLLCSPTENPKLFQATVGGLGLTGLMLWAELRLKRIRGPGIAMERIRFGSLDQFFELAAEDQNHEYAVAWIDCLARGPRLGRGIYLRGDHTDFRGRVPSMLRPARLQIPLNAPTALLNRLSLAAFNALYYRRQYRPRVRLTLPYASFFFPLDGIAEWGRLYGARGFLQHQCVVPDAPDGEPLREILSRVSRSSEIPALAVLKRFGTPVSPGLLSFPRAGITLALDLPFRGTQTLELLEQLDQLVASVGGAVYPAKDARMSPESFRTYFPQWQSFSSMIDPKFSSSFWRRVAAQ
jgi:FAD/FMN-containing dehydrogenase